MMFANSSSGHPSNSIGSSSSSRGCNEKSSSNNNNNNNDNGSSNNCNQLAQQNSFSSRQLKRFSIIDRGKSWVIILLLLYCVFAVII
jgi:hypothetical protein